MGAGDVPSTQMQEPESHQSKKLIDDLEDCANSGAIGPNDSVIFNSGMFATDEERIANIFVGDPVERVGKIYFTVKGYDKQGGYEIERRFSDFEALRKALSMRLSGLYVPKLPKSSFFGDSKDIKFLQERAFHIEQFLKKVTRLKYLLYSPEFTVLTRPDTELREKDGKVTEIPKQLEMLQE